MSLLKNLLIEKKLFEATEEIDAFLEGKDIDEAAVVIRIEFDSSIYSEKDQVRDFLNAHLLGEHEVEEIKKGYKVVMFDDIAFIPETIKSVELREGLHIFTGILRPMSPDNPVLFGDVSENIKLSADHPYVIEVARVVKGFHPAYGEVVITEDDLLSFKNNFEAGVVGVDISIDFDHETREAAGWIKELFLSEDNKVLLAGVKWTPKGALSLSNREFRYFSPEFNRNWVHPHTGIAHGPTLLGGGLVNRPFLKMEAIVSMKDKQLNGGSNVETIKLSDHNAKVGELENEITTLKLSEEKAKTAISGLKADNEKLSDELKTLKAEIAEKERVAEINQLFSENKINQAQKDAMLEGKSLVDVLKLGDALNPKPQGNAEADNDDAMKLSDQEKAFCAKFGISHDDYLKYNK